MALDPILSEYYKEALKEAKAAKKDFIIGGANAALAILIIWWMCTHMIHSYKDFDAVIVAAAFPALIAVFAVKNGVEAKMKEAVWLERVRSLKELRDRAAPQVPLKNPFLD
jgi:hypothetical protein